MGVNIQKFSLRIVKESGGRYDLENKIVRQPFDVKKILVEVIELDKRAEEVFVILTVDIKNQVTGIFEVSVGSINSSIVTAREVFKRAILQNACSIILAHNHPSGIPEPSKDDIKITKRLINAGEVLGIEVLDHIIIGSKDNFSSMKEKSII